MLRHVGHEYVLCIGVQQRCQLLGHGSSTGPTPRRSRTGTTTALPGVISWRPSRRRSPMGPGLNHWATARGYADGSQPSLAQLCQCAQHLRARAYIVAGQTTREAACASRSGHVFAPSSDLTRTRPSRTRTSCRDAPPVNVFGGNQCHYERSYLQGIRPTGMLPITSCDRPSWIDRGLGQRLSSMILCAPLSPSTPLCPALGPMRQPRSRDGRPWAVTLCCATVRSRALLSSRSWTCTLPVKVNTVTTRGLGLPMRSYPNQWGSRTAAHHGPPPRPLIDHRQQLAASPHLYAHMLVFDPGPAEEEIHP